MRRTLLAATALATLSLIPSPAHAGLEVTLGGYQDFRAGFFDNDLTTAPRRHNDFQNEFQLEIEAKAKAMNGMEYGVIASLWNGNDYTTSPPQVAGAIDPDDTGSARNSIRLHQAYGYVSGVFGQIRMGDEHGASDFAVHAPTTYDWGGQINGSYTQFLTQASVWGVTPSFVDDLENNTKVTYFTPKLGMHGHKFQAGVSYTPNWYDSGLGTVVNNSASANTPAGGQNYKDMLEAGASYEGDYRGLLARVGGVFTYADNVTGVQINGDPLEDFTAWSAGAQLSYKGFTVGGGYADAGDYNATTLQTNDQRAWNAGASFKFDRFSVAGSYLNGKGYMNMLSGSTTVPADNYISNYTVWGVGAGYSLFDGMVTSVDAVFYDQDGQGTVPGNADNNGHVVIVSNRISF